MPSINTDKGSTLFRVIADSKSYSKLTPGLYTFSPERIKMQKMLMSLTQVTQDHKIMYSYIEFGRHRRSASNVYPFLRGFFLTF